MVQKTKYRKPPRIIRLVRMMVLRKKYRFIDFTEREIHVYDAQTSISELTKEAGINFMWGFTGNLPAPFISAGIVWGIIFAFFIYYFVVSYIFNREKYETKLGRYIIMPIPATCGAVTSYFFATILIHYFKH